MRSSAAFFDTIPEPTISLRESIPFRTIKLPIFYPRPKIVSIPRVSYQLKKGAARPTVSAQEQAQKKLVEEVKVSKHISQSLDQLIEQAVNFQLKQAQLKTVQKPSYQTPRQFFWPEEKKIPQFRLSPKKKVSSLPPPALHPKIVSQAIFDKTKIPVPPKVSSLIKTPPTQKIVPKEAPKMPAPPITISKIPSTYPVPDLLDYILLTIPLSQDPYNDSKRRIIIYALKIIGYLTILLSIFEFERYNAAGHSLNGMLEIVLILILAGIIMYFATNFSLLFKPANPYQIHELR